MIKKRECDQCDVDMIHMKVSCLNKMCPNYSGEKELLGTETYKQLSKWDLRFLLIAKHVGAWSKDPSSKVGAVITNDKVMIASGFNGFPKNTDDDENIYKNRDKKYLRIIHAEINAILYARCNISGFTLYCTAPTCCQCTAAIIQSGISKVIYNAPNQDFIDRWGSHINESKQMYSEAMVELIEY